MCSEKREVISKAGNRLSCKRDALCLPLSALLCHLPCSSASALGRTWWLASHKEPGLWGESRAPSEFQLHHGTSFEILNICFNFPELSSFIWEMRMVISSMISQALWVVIETQFKPKGTEIRGNVLAHFIEKWSRGFRGS